MYHPVQDRWALMTTAQKDQFIADFIYCLRDCLENDCENPGDCCVIYDENEVQLMLGDAHIEPGTDGDHILCRVF